MKELLSSSKSKKGKDVRVKDHLSDLKVKDHLSDVKVKDLVSDDFDQKFGNYKCKYCHYVSAQKWILERHVSSVHFKVCILDKLCICKKVFSPDVPKDPYRSRAFKNWH